MAVSVASTFTATSFIYQLIAVLTVTFIRGATSSSKMDGIVPDIIPVIPKEVAVVKYGELSVELGNELTPTQVKEPPTTVSWTAEPDAFYTLIMVDPDFPSTAAFKQVQHWRIINIPGNDITKGEIMFPYIGSGPPKEFGLKRYVFAIYKQPKKIEKSEIEDIKDRLADRTTTLFKDFVEKYNLGDPVAANFYRAQYDDYVPEMHKKFHAMYLKED